MGVGVVHSLHEVMNPTLECGPSYVAGRADRHVEAGRLTGFDRVINRVNTHAIRHRIGTIGVAKRERGAFGIVARGAARRAAGIACPAREIFIHTFCRTIRGTAYQCIRGAGIGVVAIGLAQRAGPWVTRGNHRVTVFGSVDDGIATNHVGAIGVAEFVTGRWTASIP